MRTVQQLRAALRAKPGNAKASTEDIQWHAMIGASIRRLAIALD